MKTPEEIKKGLEYCMSGNAPCERCPFVTHTGSACIQHMSEDALAAELGQVKRERDAMKEEHHE